MTRQELNVLLPLIMRERDYIEVTTHQASVFRSVDEYAQLIHLENETGTVNWKSETLPDTRPGMVRLWTRQDWQLTDNVRAKLKLTMNAERERIAGLMKEMETMRGKIITHFATMTPPIPRSIIEGMILKDADHAKLTAIIAGLNSGGASL